MVARQPPPIPEEGTASPGLVELGIGESWEEQDIPEETHDAMEMAMSRRLAQERVRGQFLTVNPCLLGQAWGFVEHHQTANAKNRNSRHSF